MTCQDIMTAAPACCVPQDSVRSAAQIMRDHDVGPVPVCDSDERKTLVGIITDRDITIKVIAEGRDAANTAVGDVMTKEVFSCFPDEDAMSALKVMEEQQVRRIPVVDRHNHVVGIISQADIANRMGDRDITAEVVSEVSKPRTRTA